eukprot:SAG22_NODE_575_length_8991_cov_12.134859_10_plen_62_part_00
MACFSAPEIYGAAPPAAPGTSGICEHTKSLGFHNFRLAQKLKEDIETQMGDGETHCEIILS